MHNDTIKLYDKIVILYYKYPEGNYEGLKMGSGFEGRYFATRISKQDW